MRLSPFCRLLVVALALVSAAWAVDFAALKPEGYVSDFARVVDPASRAQLERYCRVVQDSTGAQMALVTLDTLAGEPIEDVANSIYRRWGVGEKGKNEGVLLLVVVRDRRTRLEVGYGLEPILPDGFDGGILREMAPALRGKQYGEAFLAAAQTIGARVASAKGVELKTAPLRRRAMRREQRIPWWMVLGGIGVLIWLLSMGGKGSGGGGFGGLLAGMLLGNMMGRGLGSGQGGGGFGGYDSGDSFGGFGGGDSGGGGASGDW
jgi:uncharacterized protein